MVAVDVEFRNVQGTGADLGWAGSHTIVVDRPQGKAGGTGLGFNGAQLLALAIGGCFSNDLRYAAEVLGMTIGNLAVSVRLELEGSPLIATSAVMRVHCEMSDGSDPSELFSQAKAGCMVSNSLRLGIPVTISHD